MPTPRPKVPCSHPGCRAYAIHDTDPPICSAHAGRTLHPGPDQHVGAPEGNANHLIHGYYSRIVRDFDGEPLPAAGDVPSLEDEIAIARVALRRILAMLLSGRTLDAKARLLNALELARLGGLAFQGTRTIARLLQIKTDIDARGEGHIAAFINEALDELSVQWGIDL